MADDSTEATSTADLYHRHGEPDPAQWDEAVAVTGRPVDEAPDNSTFAERAKARVKVVRSETAEDKAIRQSAKKARKKSK